MKTQHSDFVTSNDGNLFVGDTHCTTCGKGFSDKSNLNRHIKSQHEGITYSCNFCDYIAKRNSTLKEHKKASHSAFDSLNDDI